MSLELVSPNTNGLLTSKFLKGKMKEVLSWDGVSIQDDQGRVISPDVRPRYEGWTFDMYRDAFHTNKSVRHIYPMGALEPDTAEDTEAEDIAELKRDGHRALCYINEDGNRLFSRVISKKTDWYSENTDQVPHIRDLNLSAYKGTILDGELDYDQTSNEVSSVTLSKPENAIQHQYENGFITYYLFDIPYYNGINIQAMPLWKRKVYLALVSYAIEDEAGIEFPHIKMMPMYVRKDMISKLYDLWYDYITRSGYPTEILRFLMDRIVEVETYTDTFQEVLDSGREGLIVKPIHGRYEQKKSKNQLKMKGLSTWDVIFLGTTEPTREYDGKLLTEGAISNWSYWENPETRVVRYVSPNAEPDMDWDGFEPVTKPYAMGWCGGIRCGVYRRYSYTDILAITSSDKNQSDGMYLEQAIDDGSVWIDKKNEQFYWIEEVAVVKGLDEATMQDIRRNEGEYQTERRVLEIWANGLLDKETGTLRHPRFYRWRDDKLATECTFQSHIREIEE